jgi:glycosyltransferase involved in cell wall biosynthesis
MKIFHFILGKAAKDRANGVNQVVAGLAKYCARQGAEVRVIGKANTAGREGELIPRDGFTVEVYSHWNMELLSSVRKAINWADVVHLHGGYLFSNILIGNMCVDAKTPYVLTLHNGLSPDLSRLRGSIRKTLFHWKLQRRHIEAAAAVHVLSEEEATDVYRAANPRRVVCIPNGVDLEDYHLAARSTSSPATISIGYIGRLSAEKNLGALCDAFSSLRNAGDYELRVAGPSSSYGAALARKYQHAGLKLVGPVFGLAKYQFISELDLLVIPSISEGFPMVAAEALAIGTPLLITRQSKLTYFFDRRAFFMCEPTAYGLERGLRQALGARAEWPERIKKGRALVLETLNWSSISVALLRAYDELGAHDHES